MRTFYNLVYSIGIYVLAFISALFINKLIPDQVIGMTVGCAEVLFGCLIQRGILILILSFVLVGAYYFVVKKVLKYKH